jgi:uncharacterized protein involved in outer membrane biogenesis
VKIFKRILLIALLILAVFVVTAYVTVKLAFPPEKIAAILRDQGTEILGRPVGLKKVGIRLFPKIRVSAEGVELANAPGFSDEPAARLERLDLSVSFWSLLKFAPVIHEVRLVEPDILFEVDSSGHNNLEGLGGSDTSETDTALTLPANVALEAFVIDGGRVRYRDAVSRLQVTLGRIDQKASLTADRELRDVRTEGTLEISEISIEDSALGLRKGGVKITVAHRIRADVPADSVNLESVQLAFQDVKATLAGRVHAMTSPSPDVDLRFSAPSVSLASLLKEIPEGISPEIRKFRAAGTASLDARVTGVVDSVSIPRVYADVTVKDGAFGHADVPQGVDQFGMAMRVRGDTLTLDRLGFVMGPNPVKMTAKVLSIFDSIPHVQSFVLDAKFDLANLTALAREMGLLDASMKVSGLQTLAVKASGPVDLARPERLQVTGEAQSTGVKVALTGYPPVTVNGRSEFSNQKIRSRLQTQIGKSDAAVDAEVTGYLAMVFPERAAGRRPHVRADVRSRLVDLDELLGVMPASEDTSAPMTEYPEWPPVDADVTVALARTRLMGLEMTAFSLKTALRQASADVNLGGTLYGGGFTSSVRAVPKTAKDMGVALKLKVNKVEANDFISRLNDHVPLKNKLLKALAGTDNSVFGQFNLDLDIVTSGLPAQFVERATGTSAFSVVEGRLVGIEWTKALSASLSKVHSSLGYSEFRFSQLKGDLALEQGKLLVRNFNFAAPRVGSALAQGVIGLDSKLNLELTQTLPAEASRLVASGSAAALDRLARATGTALPAGSLLPTDASGRALVYYKIGGEVTKPSFTLDAKRMANEGAAGAAKTALQDALKQKEAEAKARLEAERAKLEGAARERVNAEKARLEAERQRAQDSLKRKAEEEARKKGKKVLKDLGL